MKNKPAKKKGGMKITFTNSAGEKITLDAASIDVPVKAMSPEYIANKLEAICSSEMAKGFSAAMELKNVHITQAGLKFLHEMELREQFMQRLFDCRLAPSSKEFDLWFADLLAGKLHYVDHT